MKASLLLSLGLLLAILAFPSRTTSDTSDTSPSQTSMTSPTSDDSSSQTSVTSPTSDDSSSQTSMTSPTSDASSSQTSMTSPTSDDSSSQTSVTSPTSDASSSQTSVTSPTSDASLSQTSVTSPTSDASSSQTSVTSPTSDASSSQTSVTSPTSDASSSQTSVTSPTLDASSSQTSVTSPTSDASPSQTSVTSLSPVSLQTTSTVITPGPLNYCQLNPCGGSASCVNLLSERYCLCLEGYYYKNESASCVKGKTFPGEIGVKVTETTDLENKTSKAYQDLYSKIVKFFEKAFNATEADSDYGQTIILKVSTSPSQSARSAMRAAAETTVYVSVVNMFNESTTLNESAVTKAIQEEAKKDNNMESYSGQDLCDYYGCEKNDEDCQNPLQCTCKPGLTRPSPQNSFCLPLECSRSCSAADRKQCLKNGDGPLTCACMPGYQKSTGDKCEACPFGYSGQDCKDPFQLILTIVGTVAGALILILLIAFIVSASSKNKKKNVEEQKLIDEDFQNVRLRQTGFSNSGFSNSGFSNNSDYSNFGTGNSIFPKVKTGFPSQTPNPYANQRSMPRPDY